MLSELINWPVIVETYTCEPWMMHQIATYCASKFCFSTWPHLYSTSLQAALCSQNYFDEFPLTNATEKVPVKRIIVTWNMSCVLHRVHHKIYNMKIHWSLWQVCMWQTLSGVRVVHEACLVHRAHKSDRKETRRCKQKCCEQDWKSEYTLHVPCLLGDQSSPWHVIFWYFHKHVLLLACPPALVTSVWLQQSPRMSWLCLLHFVWLTSGLCLPAGHGLTLSSTSLPGRPANEVNVPPSRVRGRHLGL